MLLCSPKDGAAVFVLFPTCYFASHCSASSSAGVGEVSQHGGS